MILHELRGVNYQAYDTFGNKRPLSLIINIKIIYCGLLPKTKKIVYTNQTLALKHEASNQFIDLRL